jgi:hypothetical protein
MRTPNRPGAASGLLMAVVLIAGCSGSGGAQPASGSATEGPSTGPASVEPSAQATPAWFGSATDLIGGTHRTFETDDGVTYYSDRFGVHFTIRPGAAWWVPNNIATLTSFDRGPNEPHGPPDESVQLVVPTKVVPPGDSALIPAPADLIDWLRARPDLVLSAPAPITVGGVSGRMVEGGLGPTAQLNPEGIVNIICGELSECGYEGGQLIAVGPTAFVEFVELQVHGTQLVIGLGARNGDRATAQPIFDAILATIAFPGP